MKSIFGKSTNDRYNAKNMAKPVNFYCSAPTALFVCLVGNFNGWNSFANPLRHIVSASPIRHFRHARALKQPLKLETTRAHEQ
jgi:1,4-alpha-glucan branching enzyme